MAGENEKMKLEDDRYCFGCGEKNPIGLRLSFITENDTTQCLFVPRKEHQGYFNYVHGGISGAVLDEIMAQWLIQRSIPAVTAKMEISFRKPVPVGETLTATAWRLRQKGRFHIMKGELADREGKVLVSAGGTFTEIKAKE